MGFIVVERFGDDDAIEGSHLFSDLGDRNVIERSG